MADDLAKAIQLQQAGDLHGAARACRALADREPGRTDAPCLLGLVLFQLGQQNEAIAVVQRAAAARPEAPEGHMTLGNLLQQAGRAADAVASFRRAAALAPASWEAQYNLANALSAAGAAAESVPCYEAAVRLNPARFEGMANLARALQVLARAAEAEDWLRRALRLRPDSVIINFNLANALRDRQATQEAVTLYRRVIALKPGLVDAYVNLGATLRHAGEIPEAMRVYEQGLKVRPDSVPLHHNLAVAYGKLGNPERERAHLLVAMRLDPMSPDSNVYLGRLLEDAGELEEAMKHYRAALEVAPEKVDARMAIGCALSRDGDAQAAIDHFSAVERTNPRYADAPYSLSIEHRYRGDIDAALACCRRALAIKPDHALARLHEAELDILRGRLAEGWDGYHWRFAAEVVPGRTLPWPTWADEPVAGRSLFLWSEQGIGDEVMFSACLPDVVAAGARCTVECDGRMVHLFSRSVPGVTFRERRVEPATLAGVELQAPIGDLPRHYRRQEGDFPRNSAYLVPDPDLCAKWQERFAALGDGLKVGISWRGGRKREVQRRRSTGLDTWRAVLSVPGAAFVNLQYGDCAAELASVRATMGVAVHDWEDADPLKDLENFAAQLATLDLVISVDNATVHFAGALGAATWALLPLAPDWRWMLGRDDTPWYRTVRLFRQPAADAWASVFADVAAQLQRRVEDGSNGR